MPYTLAEFFCGCGGFSHGFARSSEFDVVLGNDIKPAALHTFQRNHISPNTGVPAIISQDIRTVTLQSVQELLIAKGIAPGELDCLIGGPPCQGFSQMRRSEERQGDDLVGFKGYNRLDQDPRNDLVLRFLEIAHVLNPKVIVIENVPQMLTHTHQGVRGGLAAAVRGLLEEMGYTVTSGVLNAADFGVPQLRERAFFLASRIGVLELPTPTHADPLAQNLLEQGRLPWVTVAEALADLPAPTPIETLGGGALDLYAVPNPGPYAQAMRTSPTFPYNHISRTYKERIIDIIRQMQPGETWDAASERMRAAYAVMIAEERLLGENNEATKARLIAEGVINPAFYKRYYWSAYTRLDPARPALTITANANFLGSGRFTHPTADRGITMREAARLQSFDDDFKLLTSVKEKDETANIGVGIDMIGEAVPPTLGEAFALHIAPLLAAHYALPENQPIPAHQPAFT
ncbi:DNA cytosine methyltransferase [Hymenobacter psychrotolerans]|uniref:Cytosine-specific methyltransferase n=1 Tax=Hymenobacter psychrotolerans DSM 18569 TaxID=1121959 RepID=A0A1M7EF73_9BACT|nr:DNA cytosine methyltransferase [Hymenobacter psychrotolerans]SHL90367.1 DNA (cytosine-5)-methyltransferase 1 [Hymenobacter psychrotolerans DSM 18569]